MTVTGSILFNLFFFVWTAIVMVFSMVFVVLPRSWLMWSARRWASGMVDLLALFVGLRYELRGDTRVLEGPVIVAAKHQSAWDTIIFYLITHDPAYVMKRELLWIPFYGWLSLKQRMITVDRKAGGSALKHLVRGARAALAAGRQIVIFPQGTRVAPGVTAPYQPGIAALYKQLDRPVIPIALNSGQFWGRRSFIKRPGTIVVEILPAIPPGLPREQFMAELERRIETATARIEAQARLSAATV